MAAEFFRRWNEESLVQARRLFARLQAELREFLEEL
jgi:hypothetical protein